MALHYDLHIHSCLSPCADDDMTPGNIMRMARLKGLDVVAVTDHQSAGNLPAAFAWAQREGLVLVPGLEISTREEVHVLCYFPLLEAALAMGAWCREHLPPMPNRPDFFGRQLLVDQTEQLVGEEPRMLIAALTLGLHDVADKARSLGGVPVPAHINRGSNGILAALGFLPTEDAFTALEVSLDMPLPGGFEGYRLLHSSDAHHLGDIAEQGHTLPVERSAQAVVDWLRGS